MMDDVDLAEQEVREIAGYPPEAWRDLLGLGTWGAQLVDRLFRVVDYVDSLSPCCSGPDGVAHMLLSDILVDIDHVMNDTLGYPDRDR